MSSKENFNVGIKKDSFELDGLNRNIQNGIARPGALSWACEYGYVEIVRSLLQIGARVNENKNYPLELASRNNHAEIVRLLINAGASTKDSVNDEGYCLRLAAWNGNATILKMLLDAGADPTIDCYKALHLALCKGKTDVIEILMDAICQKRVADLRSK